MDRVALVRAQIEQRKEVARIAGSAPPCRVCQYKMGERCKNIAVGGQYYEPDTGTYFEYFKTTTAEARSEKGLCGPEALLFEPKTPQQMKLTVLRETLWNGALYAVGAVVVIALATDFL